MNLALALDTSIAPKETNSHFDASTWNRFTEEKTGGSVLEKHTRVAHVPRTMNP
jgi:hypothetical protein